MVYRNLNKRDKLYLFVPLDYSNIQKVKNIKYKGENLKTDFLVSLMHDFILRYYFYKDDQLKENLTFNVSATLLREKYGHKYKLYMEYLLLLGFIELVSKYYNGGGGKGKSNTYRLLNYKNVTRVEVTDRVLLYKNTREYLSKTFLKYSKSPIPKKIRDKMVQDLYQVDIDYDKSKQLLERMLDSKNITYSKYLKNMMVIESIDGKNMFFKFDDYGRMHTNFTILKREIRKNFLTIDGEILTEIDLNNSQPLFLAVLMKRELSPSKLIDPEISRYIELVDNGLIYEDLMERCNVKTREEAKMTMYKVLFGINGDSWKYNEKFKEVYPKVYHFIKNYKYSKKNYKSLSHALQKLESEFIFNNVIDHIMKINPNIKIFTVHDSLCLPIKYEKTVKDIFDYHKRQLLS